MRPLIIATVLCSCGACSCDSTPCLPQGGGAFGGAGGGDATMQVGYVGQPVQVDLQLLETFTGCDNAASQVPGIAVEVLDPLNQKVAATATQPVVSQGEVSATVTFTPASPGAYHVAARFTPNGGTLQRDLQVAVDKRTTTPNQFSLGTDAPVCDEIDFDGQTLLCHDVRASSPVLRTMRLEVGQGKTISVVPADAFALTDGQVWAYSGLNGLSVYGLGSNGELALLGSIVVSAGNSPRLLAQGDDALFLDTAGFARFTFLADGGISATTTTPLAGAGGAQWLPGTGAVVFSGAGVCSYSLPPGGAVTAAGGCTPLQSASLIGYDADGVWWLDSKMNSLTAQTLFVSGWHDGQPRPTVGSIGFLSSDPPLAPSGAQNAVTPIIYGSGPNGNTTDVFLPRFDGSNVYLERYPLIDQTKQAQADSKYLWYTENGVLTWYPR